jgi:hypothetical protein
MTTPAQGNAFPLQLELDSPLQITRWRPLVNWFLAIPHFIVLYVLSAVSGIAALIAWFSIVFTGSAPEGLQGFQVMTLRYQWRTLSFVMFMREQYPEFDFTTTTADPGNDPAHLSVVPDTTRNRITVIFRLLLVIPQYIVLIFVALAAYVCVAIGALAVLFTGSWPEGLRKFVIGFARWGARVGAYYYLLTDVYPPFSLD